VEAAGYRAAGLRHDEPDRVFATNNIAFVPVPERAPDMRMSSSDAATGMHLAQMGRLVEALPYLDRANRQAPTDVPLLHAAANLLLRAGRGEDAIERYRIAASLSPDDAGILGGWTRALLIIGDRDRAVALVERTLALDPHYANVGGMLDRSLRETTDADAACELLQALVERNPQHAGLRGLHGQALLTAERLQEAQEAYEGYRDLLPLDPLPRVELGALATSRGDRAAALEHYRSALEADPGYAAALWGFAQASGWRLEPEMLDSIRRMAESERNPRALAGLQDILARHCDRIGDYPAASLHAARANALMAQMIPQQDRYDGRRHEQEIANTIRGFASQLFDRLRDAGRPERRPVFVIGLPRSGTTLLEQMLASHPGIVGVGEQSIAAASLHRAMASAGGSLENLTPAAVDDAATWHLEMLYKRVQRLANRGAADRIVDKMPDNYLLAGWLRIAFPNATIIHCLRDPRDVALSCWMTQFAGVPWSLDLQHIAHRIEQHRRLLHHWRGAIGDHLTDIRYEQLVADPEAELRRALAAIGLDWHAGVLAHADRKGFVASASRQQVREPIHARKVARWRNYEHALRPILPRLDAVAAQDERDAASAG